MEIKIRKIKLYLVFYEHLKCRKGIERIWKAIAKIKFHQTLL